MGRDEEWRLDREIGLQKSGLTHANEIADTGSAIAGGRGPIESLQHGGGLRAKLQPKETRSAPTARQGVRRRNLANDLDEVSTRPHDLGQEAGGSAMRQQLRTEFVERISHGPRHQRG
jgi:hypothetical protein